MKTLAIDYGLRKIGLAISGGKLAEPLVVVRHQSLLAKKIAAICQKHKIERVIIGLPEGKLARQVRLFGRSLSRRINKPVVFQAETLMTKEAIVKMIEAGRGRKYRREKEDAFAAALILQAYLDSLGDRQKKG